MPPAMSPLGIFHTIISLAAIPYGIIAFARAGRIDPHSHAGKGYMFTMLVGCLTAFGIYHHGGFGPGHVLSIVTLVFMAAGYFADRVAWLGRAAPYVQTISLSITFFLLMFFTTTESLTRLPVSHPYAPSQDAPELLPVRIVLLVGLVVGVAYQVVRLRGAMHTSLKS